MIERRLIGSALLCLFFLGGMAQEQRYNGYPSREGNIDIKETLLILRKGMVIYLSIGGMAIR